MRVKSLPLSMWLLTTGIYSFWGTSNTLKFETSIHDLLFSFKNCFLNFVITCQVYISLLYSLTAPSPPPNTADINVGSKESFQGIFHGL